VLGVAHCVGIPATASEQSGLYNIALRLHGDRLALDWRSGRSWQNVDLRSWRVSPAAAGGIPWLWLGIGLGLAATLVLLLRRIGLPEGTLSPREA
jgi:hypothetical protein